MKFKPGKAKPHPITAKNPKGAGRKTVLTLKLAKQIAEMSARGCTQQEIAHIIGVAGCALTRWKRNPQFAELFAAGRSRGIERRLKRIEDAGKKGHWQADAWYLERVHPDRFARRTEITGIGGGPVRTTATELKVNVSPQELQQMVEELRNKIASQTAGQLTNGNGNGNGHHTDI